MSVYIALPLLQAILSMILHILLIDFNKHLCDHQMKRWHSMTSGVNAPGKELPQEIASGIVGTGILNSRSPMAPPSIAMTGRWACLSRPGPTLILPWQQLIGLLQHNLCQSLSPLIEAVVRLFYFFCPCHFSVMM